MITTLVNIRRRRPKYRVPPSTVNRPGGGSGLPLLPLLNPLPPRNVMNNVIGLPTANPHPFEVMVMEPRSFEEMPQAIQALRERKSVVLNVTLMEPDLAQRAVDFVAGGTYAIDGHQERLGESIFLFTPNGVQVSTRTSAPNPVPLETPSSLRNTPPSGLRKPCLLIWRSKATVNPVKSHP